MTKKQMMDVIDTLVDAVDKSGTCMVCCELIPESYPCNDKTDNCSEAIKGHVIKKAREAGNE